MNQDWTCLCALGEQMEANSTIPFLGLPWLSSS